MPVHSIADNQSVPDQTMLSNSQKRWSSSITSNTQNTSINPAPHAAVSIIRTGVVLTMDRRCVSALDESLFGVMVAIPRGVLSCSNRHPVRRTLSITGPPRWTLNLKPLGSTVPVPLLFGVF
jgi:hypothetical protein